MKSGIPTHASRQLSNGRWTSKLGPSERIEHDFDALEGAAYGQIAQIMRRPDVTSQAVLGVRPG